MLRAYRRYRVHLIERVRHVFCLLGAISLEPVFHFVVPYRLVTVRRDVPDYIVELYLGAIDSIAYYCTIVCRVLRFVCVTFSRAFFIVFGLLFG